MALDPQALAAQAERMNHRLPKLVAPGMRMDRVEAIGLTLTYLYTLENLTARQLRAMRLEVTQRPDILPNLCTDRATGRMLREGVRFRYVYRGRDGAVGGDLTLTKADC
jgi:hypothetical protein